MTSGGFLSDSLHWGSGYDDKFNCFEIVPFNSISPCQQQPIIPTLCTPPLRAHHLENRPLGLRNLRHIDIPNQENPQERKNHDTRPRNQHLLLRIPIRLLDANPRRGANSIAQLRIQIPINCIEIRLRLLRQEAHQRTREGIRPDSATNRVSDRAADVAGYVEQGEHRGDVLMVGGGKDGDLFADDNDGAAYRDEDLAHDNVANILVWLAEMDHETLGEDVEWDGEVQEPFEVACLADEEADTKEEGAGEDVEG